MIGEDFILEFFNQFGPFALALLSFTEAIIQPIPPDVMFLPMAYDERNSANMLLWLWFIVTFASVLGAMVGHALGKRYGTKLLDRFGKPTRRHARRRGCLDTEYHQRPWQLRPSLHTALAATLTWPTTNHHHPQVEQEQQHQKHEEEEKRLLEGNPLADG